VTVTDGRVLRRVRNKDAAVDAILDLLQEGVTAPTAQQVAARSGVSLRSIFRLFEDVEGLNAAAVQRQAARIESLLVPLPESGPLFVRIAALVDSRATIWDAIAPVRRHAVRLAAGSEVLGSELARTHRFFRRQVRAVFAAEIGGDDELLDALDAAASWETWELLRSGRGLSRTAAARVVTRTLTALLADKEFSR
jgi:TetR/AcrR family transcriptional regulator, regulator of autoinduction and epiphytic fitness